MFKRSMLLAAIILTGVAGCSDQPQPVVENPGQAGNEYPPIMSSAVVEEGAALTRVSTGHGYTEGPVADAEGNVYFVDIPFNSIFKISLDGERTRITGRSGSANGLAIDKNGVLVAALNGDRSVVSIDAEGNYTTLFDRYDGKRLNNPNDLWVDNKNGIYFTDPTYYLRDSIEQDGKHVYYISPDRTTITRVVDDMREPNGIAGTPDNKYLYIADAGGGAINRFTINSDATLSNKEVLIDRGTDGMTLDSEGNIYLSGRGISVYTSEGELIEVIPVPERTTNFGFGGADRKTLFIAARTSVFTLRMKVEGIPGL